MERLECIKMSFSEFQTVMDYICGTDNSYMNYWDINSSGVFFRKSSANFDMIELARYFGVNRIKDIIYAETSARGGTVFVIAE